MNDIVQSQEKSMEGHLQVLFKVRGLKSKSLETKYEAPMKFCGGGVGLQIRKEPWRELGYFLWRYGQIDEAS